MKNRSWLFVLPFALGMIGCIGRRATQAEKPLLPDPYLGKIWLVNHWSGRDDDFLPKRHYAALVNQVALGDGGGAGWVSVEFEAETKQFTPEIKQYPAVHWSSPKRWPVYWRVEPADGETFIPFHWGREHIWLGIRGYGKIELDWNQKKAYTLEHWALDGGGVYSIPPLVNLDTGSCTSVSVFPLENTDLANGNARYFLEIQYLSGDFHRHFGLVDAFGDPVFTESMVLQTGKPAQYGQVGVKWLWQNSSGFEPQGYPEIYLFTPEQDKVILPRKRDQILQMGAYSIWMGAVEVRSSDRNRVLGFGNLCIMTTR